LTISIVSKFAKISHFYLEKSVKSAEPD